MLNHTQILGIENISSSLVLIDRHIFPGPCLLHNGIFPAAGMGTGPLVGISSCEEIAQQASTRIGNAHSPMDKCLNLHIPGNIGTNLPDFLQGKLPCTHHTLSPQFMPEPVSAVIGVVGLGADMPLNLRADFLCDHKNTGV